MHKSGFVNIVGNPNAGKSTLMNALVGERLSIITSKAQTTRHRILGIVNGDDFQMIYSDTPGILAPKYKLHEGMMQFVGSAIADADVLLFVVDLTDDTPIEPAMMKRIQGAKVPVLGLLNKTDVVSKEKLQQATDFWKKEFPAAEWIPVSALTNDNVIPLFSRILDLLPEHPAYYPKDTLTDRPERFFVAEIVREKILLTYDKEIPYSVEVIVDSYREEETIDRIRCTIYCMRDSQKAILIGHQGSMLKKVGTAARLDMEKFLQKKVFLELFVKVDKDWRDSERSLKFYGYLGK
jgi:GTPase